MENNGVTKKFIIENHTNISDYVIMKRIIRVIDMGLITGNAHYCYATRFAGCFVEMLKKKYGYKILILEDKDKSKLSKFRTKEDGK